MRYISACGESQAMMDHICGGIDKVKKSYLERTLIILESNSKIQRHKNTTISEQTKYTLLSRADKNDRHPLGHFHKTSAKEIITALCSFFKLTENLRVVQ